MAFFMLFYGDLLLLLLFELFAKVCVLDFFRSHESSSFFRLALCFLHFHQLDIFGYLLIEKIRMALL